MKISAGFRLSSDALDLLRALAEKLGLSQAGVLEMIIRRTAAKEFIKQGDKK
jgi:hypothetical protein